MSSERQLLDPEDPWWGEHVHRYREVLPFVKENDIILDLACGTGFGSDILAGQTEGKVIGGDIVDEVIKECNKNWKRPQLQFAVLDGTNLPYESNYFDKIVSFETIEHTTEYQKMLQEFLRVLKPGGMAFISTPNFPINSPTGKVMNPYHTQEFTYDELKGILNNIFREVSVKGQEYSRYDKKKANLFGQLIRGLLAVIGIRKLPAKIKNNIARFFTKRPLYPTPDDFTMVDDLPKILKCKTLYCICRK